MSTNRNIRQMSSVKISKKSFKKEIIEDGKIVTVNHLLRSLPFPSKYAFCSLRKNALFNALRLKDCDIKKSSSISQLLDIAKEVFLYEEALAKVNKGLTIIQQKYKGYLHNVELRLQGPGIPVSRCVNEDCPYTMEALTDINKFDVITWKDDKIYGCDFNAIYELFSKKLESNGVLFLDKVDYYNDVIQSYTTLSERNRRSPFNRNPLASLFNPFTRAPFPAEFFVRIIEFGKRKCLLKNIPQNRRILRRDPSVVVDSVRPSLLEQDNNVDLDEINEVSAEVSDLIQSLDFYTPANILNNVIEPLVTYIRLPANSPVSINTTYALRTLGYLTTACLPMIEQLTIQFNSPIMRNRIRDRSLRFFAVRFRREVYYRMILDRCNDIHQYLRTTQRVPRIVTDVRNTVRLFLHVWYNVMNVFVDVIGYENVDIPLDDKKSIAISMIIALVNAGHLREGFEWAIGI